jgi:hypothetical protein
MTPKELEIQTCEARIAWLKDPSVKIEAKFKNDDDDPWGVIDPIWADSHYYRLAKPKVKKKVPLTAEDWKGLWFFRYDFWASKRFELVTSVDCEGFSANSSRFLYWDEIVEKGLRSRDCVEWLPCYKEVEE